MGLWLVGRHPARSRGGYSNGPGLNAGFESDARNLHGSPLGYRYLLTQWKRMAVLEVPQLFGVLIDAVMKQGDVGGVDQAAVFRAPARSVPGVAVL